MLKTNKYPQNKQHKSLNTLPNGLNSKKPKGRPSHAKKRKQAKSKKQDSPEAHTSPKPEKLEPGSPYNVQQTLTNILGSKTKIQLQEPTQPVELPTEVLARSKNLSAPWLLIGESIFGSRRRNLEDDDYIDFLERGVLGGDEGKNWQEHPLNYHGRLREKRGSQDSDDFLTLFKKGKKQKNSNFGVFEITELITSTFQKRIEQSKQKNRKIVRKKFNHDLSIFEKLEKNLIAIQAAGAKELGLLPKKGPVGKDGLPIFGATFLPKKPSKLRKTRSQVSVEEPKMPELTSIQTLRPSEFTALQLHSVSMPFNHFTEINLNRPKLPKKAKKSYCQTHQVLPGQGVSLRFVGITPNARKKGRMVRSNSSHKTVHFVIKRHFFESPAYQRKTQLKRTLVRRWIEENNQKNLDLDQSASSPFTRNIAVSSGIEGQGGTSRAGREALVVDFEINSPKTSFLPSPRKRRKNAKNGVSHQTGSHRNLDFSRYSRNATLRSASSTQKKVEKHFEEDAENDENERSEQPPVYNLDTIDAEEFAALTYNLLLDLKQLKIDKKQFRSKSCQAVEYYSKDRSKKLEVHEAGRMPPQRLLYDDFVKKVSKKVKNRLSEIGAKSTKKLDQSRYKVLKEELTDLQIPWYCCKKTISTRMNYLRTIARMVALKSNLPPEEPKEAKLKLKKRNTIRSSYRASSGGSGTDKKGVLPRKSKLSIERQTTLKRRQNQSKEVIKSPSPSLTPNIVSKTSIEGSFLDIQRYQELLKICVECSPEQLKTKREIQEHRKQRKKKLSSPAYDIKDEKMKEFLEKFKKAAYVFVLLSTDQKLSVSAIKAGGFSAKQLLRQTQRRKAIKRVRQRHHVTRLNNKINVIQGLLFNVVNVDSDVRFDEVKLDAGMVRNLKQLLYFNENQKNLRDALEKSDEGKKDEEEGKKAEGGGGSRRKGRSKRGPRNKTVLAGFGRGKKKGYGKGLGVSVGAKRRRVSVRVPVGSGRGRGRSEKGKDLYSTVLKRSASQTMVLERSRSSGAADEVKGGKEAARARYQGRNSAQDPNSNNRVLESSDNLKAIPEMRNGSRTSSMVSSQVDQGAEPRNGEFLDLMKNESSGEEGARRMPGDVLIGQGYGSVVLPEVRTEPSLPFYLANNPVKTSLVLRKAELANLKIKQRYMVEGVKGAGIASKGSKNPKKVKNVKKSELKKMMNNGLKTTQMPSIRSKVSTGSFKTSDFGFISGSVGKHKIPLRSFRESVKGVYQSDKIKDTVRSVTEYTAAQKKDFSKFFQKKFKKGKKPIFGKIEAPLVLPEPSELKSGVSAGRKRPKIMKISKNEFEGISQNLQNSASFKHKEALTKRSLGTFRSFKAGMSTPRLTRIEKLVKIDLKTKNSTQRARRPKKKTGALRRVGATRGSLSERGFDPYLSEVMRNGKS